MKHGLHIFAFLTLAVLLPTISWSQEGTSDGPLPKVHIIATGGTIAGTGFCIDNLEELPEVGIVYGYGSCSTVALEAFVNAGYKGIVFPLATTSDIDVVRSYFRQGYCQQ